MSARPWCSLALALTLLVLAGAPPRASAAGPDYPSAGWLPYGSGPLVTTVAAMYGPTPLTACRIPNATGGSGCLTQNSAQVIATQWTMPFTLTEVQQEMGGTDHYRTAVKGNGANPFFVAYPGDPAYDFPLGYEYGGRFRGGAGHIPRGAAPQLNSDHHLDVRDTTSGRDWEFIRAPIPSDTGGVFQAGTVDYQSYATGEGIGLGGTAGNISLAWSVRAQDILAGRIPHALTFIVSCDTTGDGRHGTYVYPVVRSASGYATDNNFFCGSDKANGNGWSQWVPLSDSAHNFDYGAHLWLDAPPDPSLAGGVSPTCDIIAYAELRALNEFGAYVNDIGPGQYFHAPVIFNTLADISDTYSGNPNGPHSYWHDVFARVPGASQATEGRVNVKVGSCGIDLSQHLHILIPPQPN